MYYIDVGEAECLDVARGLWLTGADYLSVWIREEGKDTRAQWRYVPTHGAYRGSQMGGYSER